jgi:hypothetical protein
MFLLSCGVTVSPPVPEALFLSAKAARSSHRAGGGVRYPSDPLFLRKFPSHIRMPVTWTTPRWPVAPCSRGCAVG